jgi:hypothetical protein
VHADQIRELSHIQPRFAEFIDEGLVVHTPYLHIFL